MKIFQLLVLVFILTVVFKAPINAQGQKDIFFNYQRNLEYFNKIADNNSEKLVFKLLQFTAPFQGGYIETNLENNGRVFTGRILPHARQATRRAVLNEFQIENIRQNLANFVSNKCSEQPVPQNEELFSVLVFKYRETFSRCNFIGQIPAQLQEIKNLLNVEYDKAEKKEIEETLAKEKIVREKYGNWESNPRNVRYSSTGSRSLVNKNAVLLYLKGKQQPVTENSREFPLYYALVRYPNGRITGGAGGGNSSFDPVSRNGINWTITDASYKPEKELIVECNVVENTISADGKVYQLERGNLFVMKFDKNWKLKIKQLKATLKEQSDDQTILSAFEKEIGENLSFAH